MPYSRKKNPVFTLNVKINCCLNFILRLLLTSRVPCFLLRGCQEENIKTLETLSACSWNTALPRLAPGVRIFVTGF